MKARLCQPFVCTPSPGVRTLISTTAIPARERAALAVFLAAVPAIGALAFFKGVPAYLHDWSWPVDRRQFLQLPSVYAAAWLDQGIGGGNAHRSLSPTVGLVSILGATLGPHWSLVCFVFISMLLAVVSSYVLSRDLGAGQGTALVAGIFYATSPLLYNRIASGHSFYWLDYALLPVIPWLSVRQRSRCVVTIGVAVVIAAASSQGEMLAIAIVVSIIFAIAYRRASCLYGLGIGLLLASPTIFAATQGLYVGRLASTLATFPSWEVNNSIPSHLALLGLGYFTHAFEFAVPWMNAYWTLLCTAGLVFIIFGALRSARPEQRFVVAALLSIGVVMTSALRGPWSSLFKAFYAMPDAAVFRDPYNFAAMTALGVVFSIGIGVRRIPQLIVVAFLLCDQLWAFSTGFYAFPRERFTPADEKALSTIALSPGNSRLLYLPMGGLLESGASRGSEYWPAVVGDHATLNSYFDEGLSLSVELALNDAKIPASDILRAAGVEWVVERHDLRSERSVDFHPDAHLKAAIVSPSVTLWRNTAYSGRSLSGWHCASPILFTDLVRAFSQKPFPCSSWSILPQPYGKDLNNELNWMLYRGQDSNLIRDSREAGITGAVFTQGGTPYPLPLQADKGQICAAGRFHVSDSEGRMRLIRDHVLATPCFTLTRQFEGNATLVPDGAVVLFGFRATPRISTTARPIELQLRGDNLSIGKSTLALLGSTGWPQRESSALLRVDAPIKHAQYGGLLFGEAPLVLAAVGWLMIIVTGARGLYGRLRPM